MMFMYLHMRKNGQNMPCALFVCLKLRIGLQKVVQHWKV